jgi:hypothetical protein
MRSSPKNYDEKAIVDRFQDRGREDQVEGSHPRPPWLEDARKRLAGLKGTRGSWRLDRPDNDRITGRSVNE